jgi:hypothetical protein
MELNTIWKIYSSLKNCGHKVTLFHWIWNVTAWTSTHLNSRQEINQLKKILTTTKKVQESSSHVLPARYVFPAWSCREHQIFSTTHMLRRRERRASTYLPGNTRMKAVTLNINFSANFIAAEGVQRVHSLHSPVQSTTGSKLKYNICSLTTIYYSKIKVWCHADIHAYSLVYTRIKL